MNHEPDDGESSDNQDTIEIFLNEKPTLILTALKDPKVENYGRPISRYIDATYAHTLKTIKRLEEHGFLEIEPTSRKNIINLTDKGDHVAEQAQNLFDAIKNKGDNHTPLVEEPSSKAGKPSF